MSKSNKAIVNVLVHLISDALLIWTFCLHIEELLNWLESQYKRSEHCLIPEFNEITQVLFPHVWCWLLVSCMHHFFFVLSYVAKRVVLSLGLLLMYGALAKKFFCIFYHDYLILYNKSIYMIDNVYWTTPVFLR